MRIIDDLFKILMTIIKTLSRSFLAIALAISCLIVFSLSHSPAIAQNDLNDSLTLVPEDTRFRDRPFSQDLFWYIPWWSDACQYYNLPDYCSYRRQHQFANATLTTKADSTAYAQAILKLENPVSIVRAREYGKILSRGELSLEEASEATSERILYDNTDPELGAGNFLEFMRTASGAVNEIIYTVSTP
jgi:hypothetical protein